MGGRGSKEKQGKKKIVSVLLSWLLQWETVVQSYEDPLRNAVECTHNCPSEG